MGCSRETVKGHWKRARKKLGAPRTDYGGKERQFHQREPEKAAAAIDALVDREVNETGTFKDVAKQAGITEGVAVTLQQKLDRQWQPVKRALGSVKTTEIRDLAAHNAHGLAEEIARRIDDGELEKEKIKDLTIAFGIYVDKHQLLDGKPTQILSTEHRHNLDALLPMLLKEARRRELMPSVEPDGVRVIEGNFSEDPA